nr:VWA domain-containing protein [Bacillus sp. FJAT-29790]
MAFYYPLVYEKLRNIRINIHIMNSSFEPIFWQFMAIGKSNKDAKKLGFFQSIFQTDFSFLEQLDNLSGRYINNANFFSVEDPSAISDEALYDLLMEEYPSWVKEATTKKLIVKYDARIG